MDAGGPLRPAAVRFSAATGTRLQFVSCSTDPYGRTESYSCSRTDPYESCCERRSKHHQVRRGLFLLFRAISWMMIYDCFCVFRYGTGRNFQGQICHQQEETKVGRRQAPVGKEGSRCWRYSCPNNRSSFLASDRDLIFCAGRKCAKKSDLMKQCHWGGKESLVSRRMGLLSLPLPKFYSTVLFVRTPH